MRNLLIGIIKFFFFEHDCDATLCTFRSENDTNDTNCLLLLMTDRWSALFKNKELILLKD